MQTTPLHSLITVPLFSAVRYDISATLSSHGSAGTPHDVYVKIVGTAGHTEELMCPSSTFNTSPRTTVTCTVTSAAEIGDYTCITWRLDGVDSLKISEFTTSIDDATQTTITPDDGWLDQEGGYGNNGQTATWCIEPTGKTRNRDWL